jgi:hypothetical protein
MLLGTLVLTLLATGFLSVPHAQAPDRPPGVSVDMWIPLSENAGIQLKREDKFHYAAPLVLHGTLFVKSAGIWQKLYLDNQGGVQLLKLR